MNWRHMQAFVWLRSRLLVNQWRRAGAINAVLMTIVAVGALATAIPLAIGTFVLAVYTIPRAEPVHLLLAWDALVAAFLFFWSLGLVTELQRSDPLSLAKFLHLPVSANGAFLLNYLSSLLRLSLVVLGPVMLAFVLALVSIQGATQGLALPLLAAFLLMVTALTYQFQGWLASLMSNPRRRRTVVVVTTMTFVLIFQLPNLLNAFAPWGTRRRADRSTALAQELAKLDQAAKAQGFGAEEYLRRQQDVVKAHKLAEQQAFREGMASLERTARLVNAIVPVGWLPLGVMTAAEGRIWPSLLGLLGMTLIGTLSLRRAYRSTVAQYQGKATSRKGRPAAAPAAGPAKFGGRLLEARLPGLSEPVSAIALGGFRSLLRSPEAKMALLSPLILGAVFGAMLLNGSPDVPRSARPLVATAGMVVVLFGLLPLMGNQFGIDRDGFRVFVLCAAPRRDILLGKNLAYAPVVLGLSTIALTVVEAICPLRPDHLLAMVPQYVSMFLLFCILTNICSIYAPVYIAAGSLNPSNPKLTAIFFQLLVFMLLFPITQALALLPLGVETLLHLLGRAKGVPIGLALSLAECAAVVLLYRLSLGWLGGLLQAREPRILEVVTNRAS